MSDGDEDQGAVEAFMGREEGEEIITSVLERDVSRADERLFLSTAHKYIHGTLVEATHTAARGKLISA